MEKTKRAGNKMRVAAPVSPLDHLQLQVPLLALLSIDQALLRTLAVVGDPHPLTLPLHPSPFNSPSHPHPTLTSLPPTPTTSCPTSPTARTHTNGFQRRLSGFPHIDVKVCGGCVCVLDF